MKKYTKKDLEAMPTLELELSARLHNISLDRLDIVENGQFIANPNVRRRLLEALADMYEAIEEAKDLIKGVK
jgi:hypothetical protein